MVDVKALDALAFSRPADGKRSHRERVIVRHREGTVVYTLASNWPRTQWWFYASNGEWRHGRTITTTSIRVARDWATLFGPEAAAQIEGRRW